MPMMYNHSITYFIILREKIDEFDIIPDLMKQQKRNITYTRILPKQESDFHSDSPDKWYYGFCIASSNETDERLVKSKYYLDNKSSWFNNKTLHRIIDNDLTQDIPLTTQEKELHHSLIYHSLVKDNVLHDGWFEIGSMY